MQQGFERLGPEVPTIRRCLQLLHTQPPPVWALGASGAGRFELTNRPPFVSKILLLADRALSAIGFWTRCPCCAGRNAFAHHRSFCPCCMSFRTRPCSVTIQSHSSSLTGAAAVCYARLRPGQAPPPSAHSARRQPVPSTRYHGQSDSRTTAFRDEPSASRRGRGQGLVPPVHCGPSPGTARLRGCRGLLARSCSHWRNDALLLRTLNAFTRSPSPLTMVLPSPLLPLTRHRDAAASHLTARTAWHLVSAHGAQRVIAGPVCVHSTWQLDSSAPGPDYLLALTQVLPCRKAQTLGCWSP
jgi:hypothetical protein